MSYTGRCACGKVRLEITGSPLAVRQCWCRQCQYFTGGGPAHNAMFNTADVKIEGELGSHAYVAESGTTIVRWFCPDCATPVYVQATTRPHFRTVRLGVIDQPHDLAPRMAIWTSMAPEWAVIDPKIEQHRGQAPVPAATPSAGTKTS